MDSEEIKKLIENNSDYWEKRALQNKLNIVENEEDYIKRLDSIYQEAMNQIDDKLAAVYARYAENNNMTLKQAYKKLPKAMEKKYKSDVYKYIEKAKAFDGNPKEMQYLLNQSLMHQHSVLDQLRTEYREVIYNIDEKNTGSKFLNKIYQNANYYEQYNNNNETFAHVSQERIQALLEENWSGGGNFSNTIWKNKEQLINALDDILIKGFAVGTSYDKMVKDLANRMETSKSAAKRLIMTESARMDNQGLLDYYREAGIEQFQFLATLDNKTSEICRAMDGKIFNIEDAQIGLNVPPLHPYCRSTIMPYTDLTEVKERTYKDNSGRNKTGKNRTYAQYVEQELGDVEQAKAITSTANSLSNLVKSIGTIIGDPVISKTNSNVLITNPNEQNKLPNDARETLLTMKGPKINDINNTLSNNLEITKELEKEMVNIDKALDMLPFYQGNVTTDISIKANNPLNDYKVGDIWKVKKYLFSTKNKQYYKEASCRFIIKSKTGKDIGSKLSNYKVNKEVIFKRNSMFIVNDIKVKDNIVYYYLEELV